MRRRGRSWRGGTEGPSRSGRWIFSVHPPCAAHARDVCRLVEERLMASERVALITAGGSGMGAAAARRLAEDGYGVAMLSSSGKGEALAAALGGIGVTGSNQSNDDLRAAGRAGDGAMGPDRRAGQQRRARAARADPRDQRRGLAPRARHLPPERGPGHPAGRADHGGAAGRRDHQHLDRLGLRADAAFPTSAVFRAGLAAYAKLFADSMPQTTCG